MGNLRERSPTRTAPARALAGLALVALLVGATAASAHHGEPATGGQEPGEELGRDSDGYSPSEGVTVGATPVPKPGSEAGWEQIAGSMWRADGRIDELVARSPTPYDVDLYGVGFLDSALAELSGLNAEKASAAAQSNGFAVGAQCRRSPASPDQPVAADRVEGCERIPVIFRYHDDPDRGLVWEESYRANDASDPGGFAAEVTWLSPARALAVGGTGTYPRREPERGEGETDAEYAERDEDPARGAGMARAWLYENGDWRELELPSEMRALTALHSSARPSDCGGGVANECAVAGGMQQLWHFADGEFTDGYGPDLNPAQMQNPSAFRFRIRDLRFAPLPSVPAGQASAMAVTAGCCGGDRTPALLEYADGLWRATPLQQAVAPAPGLDGPDSFYALRVFRADAGGTFPAPKPTGTSPVIGSGIRAPGGPSDGYGAPAGQSEEPGSCVTAANFGACKGQGSVALRLVAGDGDIHAECVVSPAGGQGTCGGGDKANGKIDWAVGSLRRSGQGAAAYTALRRESPGTGTLNLGADTCKDDDALLPGAGLSPGLILDSLPAGAFTDQGDLCSPAGFENGQRSRTVFKLGSYALNAFWVVGEDAVEGDPGTGWAVGDHGAIVLRGASGAIDEEHPPRLGSRGPAELVDTDPYAAHRKPPTDRPGLVPALAARPIDRLREPRFVSAGIPNGNAGAVETIAISRDGSEGWAFGSDEIGASGQSAGVYHLEHAEWRLCLPRDSHADPACASLGPYGDLTVRDAERVPLERDSDPSNDDELEIAALTDDGLLRYGQGQWELDDHALVAASQTGPPEPLSGQDIAFTAPDDGWAVGSVGSLGGGSPVFHFDGRRWMRCTGVQPDPDCGDPDQRLSVALEQSLAGGQGGINNTRNLRGLRFAVAGERVYAYGTRRIGGEGTAVSATAYPMIIYRDRGEVWTGGIDKTNDGTYNPADGGWDPARYVLAEGGPLVRPPPVSPLVDPLTGHAASAVDGAVRGEGSTEGRVFTVSVAETDDGIEGWSLGTYGSLEGAEADAVMLRLKDGRWLPWSQGDAVDEKLREQRPTAALDPRSHLTLPQPIGGHSAWIFQPAALAFNGERQRWEALRTPWIEKRLHGLRHARASDVHPAVPDGQGGFWVGVRQDGGCSTCGNQFAFFRHTDRAPRPVFEDVANPARNAAITAMDASANGTVWLGDQSGTLHRYDRLVGWQRNIKVPGWNPPRVTSASPITALAVGPDGSGVAVGPAGRIADLGFGQVELNDAAGRICRLGDPATPCGTGRDLIAAAVSPDGAALVGGVGRALLWRPAGGGFRPLELPLPRNTTLTHVELPRPDRAYLLTSAQQLLRGELQGGRWDWSFELGTADGADPLAGKEKIGDIAIDPSGRGYAVGQKGLLLRREGDGERPWRRIASEYRDDLHSVALPAGGKGGGALIGAERGLILTVAGERLAAARPADPFDPLLGGFINYGSVHELALAPGTEVGQIEAWAVIRANDNGLNRSPPPQALLHHASGPSDPLLDLSRGLTPLDDAPSERPGEIAFAAFGKQECQTTRMRPGGNSALGAEAVCRPLTGSNLVNEVIARGVNDELADRAERPAGPEFALFTGDAVDGAGGGDPALDFPQVGTPVDLNAAHRRWIELVADPLTGALPLLGTIGRQDLALHSEVGTSGITDTLTGGNLTTRQIAEGTGVRGGLFNFPWRNTMAAMPAPWHREESGEGRVAFEPLREGVISQPMPEASTPGARRSVGGGLTAGAPTTARLGSISTAGAPTHYATDVIRDGEVVARVVGVDTSLGSLAASNAAQHPIEVGGQERWLEEVLCFEGSPEDTDDDIRDCTRSQGQSAIVLTNTPTYSYGPISPDETLADAASFEAIMLRHRVSVVVSGRLGWNGRYWTLAPGVHAPCPSQPYRPDSDPPSLRDTEICGAQPGGAAQSLAPDPSAAFEGLPDEAREAAGLAGEGAVPFVVSSSAGGRFNERAERSGQTSAEAGFWRGYSIVRLHPSGDPAKTIVEQRPVFDWLALDARERALAPGEQTKLSAYGREPAGMDVPLRFVEIPDTQAITHRYELLLADPERPWMPCEAGDERCEALHARLAEGSRSFDSAQDDNSHMSSRAEASRSDAAAEGPRPGAPNVCEPYVCLPERVGTVNADSGRLRAGNGKYPDTFAIAMLSLGDHVAAAPMIFKRSPSFVVNPALGFPEIPPPPMETGTAQTPPPPPPAQTPPIPNVNSPQPPLPPPIAPIQAAQPPEPQPPAPPVPPPPTEQPSPLNLALAPPSLAIATPTAVIQPPTPPVNPAPPGGARREARQRQAAAQKSGADNEETGSEGQGDVDLVQNPGAHGSNSATRRDRTKPEPSFTTIARADQPSAWTQGALYGGSITLMALALSLAWTKGRPTPRRRPPHVPAPARAYARRRLP